MAESVVLLTNGHGSGFGTQTYTTSSVSPTANRLIEVDVSLNSFETTVGTITLSGGGLSNWVEVQTQIFSGSSNRISKFRGMSASPGSGTIGISIAGTINNSCMWAVKEWDGVDTSGTDGSGAIKQSAKNSTNGGSPNSLTVTLGSAITSGNAVSAAFAVAGDTLQTADGGYTETSDDDGLGIGDVNSLMTCYNYSGTTTPTASGQPDFADIGGIAAEIQAGSSGTVLSPTVGAQVYTGAAASLLLGLSPVSGAITYSGNTPALLNQLLPTVGSQVYGGNQPSITNAFLLSPTEGNVNFNGLTPSLNLQLLTTEGNIVFAGNAPTLGGATNKHFIRRHGRVYYA